MSKYNLGRTLRNEFKWLGFTMPLVGLLLVISYYPIFYALYGSFVDVSEMDGVFASPFTGLSNYQYVFNDPRFYRATYVTFALMLLSLIYIPIAFLLAYGINSLGKGKLQSVFRVAFFAPYVIPSVAVVMIFQVLLDTNGGVLNAIISSITGQNVFIGWLSSPDLARIGVSFISNYSSLPFGIIICMAGLQAIPDELLEAAQIDGANSFQRMIRIVMPNMFGIFVFLIVTQVIFGFQRIVDLIIVSRGWPTGAPGGSLQSLMMLIYEQSFFRHAVTASVNYGTTYALTIILFLIILTVTLLNLIISNIKRGK